MHLPICTAALLFLPALATSLPAQLLRGGDLLTTDYSTNAVYRVDDAGAVSTLWAGSPLAGPSGITATRDGDIVVVDYTSDRLVRFDRFSGTPTTFATGLGGPLRLCEDHDGTFLVTGISPPRLLRATAAGVLTTVASGAPLVRPFDVALDLNGDYLVADDSARGVFRVTRAGVVLPIHTGLPLRLPQGVALFPNGDYAVIDGLTDSVFRIDRNTNQIAVFCPTAALGGNPEGIVPDASGGFFVSQSQASGSRIAAVDPLGNATTAAAGAPFVNLEDVARIPFLTGPTRLTTGPGSSFQFGIDAAGRGGEYYTLVLSASVFPGWQFPNDVRSLAVNVDPFFLATIGQGAPPFLGNWSGFLDANGRATATTDLSSLPTGALAGLEFFQQGLTLTSTNQLGIALDVRRLTLH